MVSAGDRAAILHGAREACATATDLRVMLRDLRNQATVLRDEALRLRVEARTLRAGRPPRPTSPAAYRVS